MSVFLLACLAACRPDDPTGDGPGPDTTPDDTADTDTDDTDTDDTDDTAPPCVPEPEIPADGIDQACNGWADELGFGVSADALVTSSLAGDEPYRALGYAIDAATVASVPWLAASGPGYDDERGKVLVDIGALDGTPDLTVEGPGGWDYFGEDLAIGDWGDGQLVVAYYSRQQAMLFGGAGEQDIYDAYVTTDFATGGQGVGAADLTGDGVDDVIVTGLGTLRLSLYEGPPPTGTFGSPILELYTPPPEDPANFVGNFALKLGEVGDLTGDGLPELTAMSENAVDGVADGGNAWILPGDARGYVRPEDIGWALTGEESRAKAGWDIVIGDVTADGYADLLTGALDPFGQRGAAYLVAGPITENGYLADGVARFDAVYDMDGCGRAVETLPDVDGDFGDEVVIGCPNAYLPGRVELYASGVASGALTAHDATLVLVGASRGDGFGASLTADADLTGDGRVDLAVGAPGDDTAATNAGAVLLFSGPWW